MGWLFVPGLGDSKTDSNLHSDHLTDVSVTLNGKPSRPQSLLRAWKTKSWMRRLSGMTLNHLTAENGVELFRLSLLDSHVNHFQSQVDNRVLKTRAISGLTLKESSEKSNPNGAFLRMSQDYSQPELLTTDTHTKSYQTGYINWVTQLRKDYSARMRLVRHTREKDSFSWPTPTVTSGGQTAQNPTPRQTGGTTLGGMARFLWPTPRAEEGKQYNSQDNGIALSRASIMWRTPKNQESGITTERLDGELGHRMYDKETGRLAQVGLTQQVQLWQTPATFRGKYRRQMNQETREEELLPAQAERVSGMWRTPSASDPEGGIKDLNDPKYRDAKQPKIKLRDMASAWGTPNARDWKGSPSKNYSGQKSLPRDILEFASSPLHRQDLMRGEKSSDSTKQLNPRFAEWLMGWIRGWTHPSMPIAMKDYEQWEMACVQLLGHLLS